jgi:hypothetical protein
MSSDMANLKQQVINAQKKEGIYNNNHKTPEEDKKVEVDLSKDKEFLEILKKKEKAEIDCAIQMSLALEAERQKLETLENSELIVLILNK